MKIQISNAGKRYNRDWIFRQAFYEFLPGNTYAVTGNNGSGKSTLLQALCGNLELSEGSINWQLNNHPVNPTQVQNHLAIAAPYLEVIEEMTASEFMQFHAQFKPILPNISIIEILKIIGLETVANKQIRYFSSGMKQRIKLAQAIFSNVPLLLLDEPCTNLDTAGIQLYQQLIAQYATGKTIIVSSNDVQEYAFCQNVLNISQFKHGRTSVQV